MKLKTRTLERYIRAHPFATGKHEKRNPKEALHVVLPGGGNNEDTNADNRHHDSDDNTNTNNNDDCHVHTAAIVHKPSTWPTRTEARAAKTSRHSIIIHSAVSTLSSSFFFFFDS